jgi:hypothetical protein
MLSAAHGFSPLKIQYLGGHGSAVSDWAFFV